MKELRMNGKVIGFQDKASPELRALIESVHKDEEMKDFELTNSPYGSDSNMTDSEFARHLRVKCRLRKQAMEDKVTESKT